MDKNGFAHRCEAAVMELGRFIRTSPKPFRKEALVTVVQRGRPGSLLPVERFGIGIVRA